MHLIENQLNEKKLFVTSTDANARVLWELESRCNLKCKYCYDSRTHNFPVPEETVKRSVDLIRQSNIEFVHISGGEPTLNPYIDYIVNELSTKKILFTTNLTSLQARHIELFFKDNIYSVAISLDSLKIEENDFLRGATSEVITNILQLLEIKKQRSSNVKIRIHSVITKVNIHSIISLLEWAKEQGIDEVSCQPVSLPSNHPLKDTLSLTEEDLHLLHRIWDKEQMLFVSKYADAHNILQTYYLTNPGSFTDAGNKLCHPFIDAKGNVWNCPRKIVQLTGLASHSPDIGRCEITPQCMCCLKRHMFSEILGTISGNISSQRYLICSAQSNAVR